MQGNGATRAVARTQSALSAPPPTPRLIGPLAEQIVAAFYLVRFGQATLDKEQTEAIEHALARLDE